MSHDVTIFECESVASHCWYYHDDELKAAKVVRNHLEDAFEYWGYTNHNVTVSSDTSYTPQKDDMGSELDYFENTWLDGHSDKSSDSNLMLLADKPSGAAGKAHLNGQGALLKYAKDLADHSYGVDRYGDPSFKKESRIRGAIHEIGHNYGMEHADGRRYDSSGTTYSTPHGCEISGDLQSTNNCGTSCSQNSIDMYDHWFDDCAENHL